MKLFVWRDVLRDYTAGVVFAMAADEQEALQVIEKNFPPYVYDAFMEDIQLGAKCDVYDCPYAGFVWGST